MQPAVDVLVAGRGDGPLAFVLKVLLEHAHTHVGIGDAKSLVGLPVNVGRTLVDHRQESRIVPRAVPHIAGVAVLLVADRLAHEVGRRDIDHQRLQAAPGPRHQGIDQLGVRLGVQLVDERTVNVEPVGRVVLGADHPIDAEPGLFTELDAPGRTAVQLAPVLQVGIRQHHAASVLEDQTGLLVLAGGPVYLGPVLAVHKQHIQDDSSAEGRFAIFTR